MLCNNGKKGRGRGKAHFAWEFGSISLPSPLHPLQLLLCKISSKILYVGNMARRFNKNDWRTQIITATSPPADFRSRYADCDCPNILKVAVNRKAARLDQTQAVSQPSFSFLNQSLLGAWRQSLNAVLITQLHFPQWVFKQKSAVVSLLYCYEFVYACLRVGFLLLAIPWTSPCGSIGKVCEGGLPLLST